MTIDILTLALENQLHLQRSFEEWKAKLDEVQNACLENFLSYLENQTVVSNSTRRIRSLIAFLDNGHLLSTHENYTGGEEDMKIAHGKYFKVRVTFDDTFTDGYNFKYAAVNAGNLGQTKYGPLCVTFGLDKMHEKKSIVYLKQNSLHWDEDANCWHYFMDEETVEISKLCKDLASGKDLTKLVCLKHADDILVLNEDRWPDLVCNASKEDYVEMITNEDITIHDIDEIRIWQQELDKIMLRSSQVIAGEAPYNDITVTDFNLLMDKVEDLNLKWRYAKA